MPNAQKEAIVSDLRAIVAQSKGAILTDYRGLTVAEVTNLRRKLRDVDAEYHIVKNTLFKIAAGDTVTPELETLLTGPTAIVFARNDVVAPTKAILDFLRDLRKPDIKVKGGWIDGRVYDVTQVTALSKLPPREQIVAQLVGTLNGPIAQLVGTLDNIIGEFVRTIQAIHDKRAEGSEPVAPAAAEASTAPEASAVPAEVVAPLPETPVAAVEVPAAETPSEPEEAVPAAEPETPAAQASADVAAEAAPETPTSAEEAPAEAAPAEPEAVAAPVEEAAPEAVPSAETAETPAEEAETPAAE
jgi:large subunit ribosomal protein L10